VSASTASDADLYAASMLQYEVLSVLVGVVVRLSVMLYEVLFLAAVDEVGCVTG